MSLDEKVTYFTQIFGTRLTPGITEHNFWPKVEWQMVSSKSRTTVNLLGVVIFVTVLIKSVYVWSNVVAEHIINPNH